ncbi:MAG: hypothetical protein L3J00_02195 [Thiomicrorhabdus sp.]|nr:hypothetical protein [Thiomicrorhabdus sp.]
MQTVDVHSELKKNNVTLLVMRLFLNLLGAARVCAINVFSIWGLGCRDLDQTKGFYSGTLSITFQSNGRDA